MAGRAKGPARGGDLAAAGAAAEDPAPPLPAPPEAGPPAPPEGAPPAPVAVVCLAPGGRRRAGRRWEEGRTEVSGLGEADLAALRADPLFRVGDGPA